MIALDPELVAFMQGGISMHAASRDAQCVPNLSRPVGLRISADRTRVTVLLLASHSGAMLEDFRANGQIALAITLASTHRSVQLKGSDATLEPLQEGDHAIVARYREAFVQDLGSIGYPAALPEKLLASGRADVVAVGFTVGAVFTQTPGPAAGTRLS